ncbi:SpoVR family protein [Geopsychrobacter electrodiphilus]|uniref:SpoVR family protein n=1 Tax=Geopsychrobacter electrodiphilus TaxID=225196 RepID=UPI00036079CE|nr:SpoVR family protein [Geopsychrobacter electrodiphilus]
MELISQQTKKIMEGCKVRAREAGLQFEDETLEYVVTNRDMLELMPKNMIPTLYDYWVHDVEVLREKGKYELYPGNPYETVINTRPAISFYNDNNPDWLNVMIFYHVLAHIDFFQNNLYFRHTWDYDLAGQALADKRLIARLRSEHGRWVDYVIEFARGIDNLVGYHAELSRLHRATEGCSRRLDYFFDVFLQQVRPVSTSEYVNQIEAYNQACRDAGKLGEQNFFSNVVRTFPEFEAAFDRHENDKVVTSPDLLQFLIDHSPMLAKEENLWMKSVLQIVRSTSIYFQPQIRTKIMNEGWASYWHETLFLQDDRISGNEIAFARVNAGVTAMPRVGLNPYALGMRLFYFIEEAADRGCYHYAYRRLKNMEQKRRFDRKTGSGRDTLFEVRENFCDFTFINSFVDQDFIDHNRLFVAGRRLDEQRMVWQYYVKSRHADDYRQMLFDSLYHPPEIKLAAEKAKDGELYLNHVIEGKPLVQEYIANTMLGIEYLWGGPVCLETSEAEVKAGDGQDEPPQTLSWKRVCYRMAERHLERTVL